ncbi:MAG: lasso peptide biosynthesis B2 protein [Alphaproteobacteria bacterium]
MSLVRRLLARRRELPLVVEATLWLLVAWLVLSLLPFQRIAPLLRPRVRAREGGDDTIERVRWAVTAAARRVPWPAVCFHQGIAAQRLLARRGIATTLRFGVRRDEGESGGGVESHVWAIADGRTVVGGEAAAHFEPLADFHSLP